VAKTAILDILRLIPRDTGFLDRRTGSKGEFFYDKDANTLRLYDGTSGGIQLARADLQNISNAVFAAKASAAGIGGGGGGGNTTVSVGSNIPVSPSNGNLWLNTNNGVLYVYVNDGSSSQWMQPSTPIPDLDNYATKQYADDSFEFYIAADDSSQVRINQADVINFLGANGITTSSDADGNITITGPTSFDNLTGLQFTIGVAISEFSSDGTLADNSDFAVPTEKAVKTYVDTAISTFDSVGNFTLGSSIIDTDDSSSITIVPAVIMNSDLIVENELFVSNTIFTDSINVTGSLTSTGSGTPEIVSDNEILLTPGTTTILNGLTTFNQTTEVLNTKTGATGTVVHDFTTGSLFFHSSIVSNFTANITNVPTTNNRSTAIAFILDQGSSAYIPNALQIDGAAQTIRWSGGSLPSGTNNYIDIVNFTLIRKNNTWTIIGSLSTYN
jgi:hypothetical protein